MTKDFIQLFFIKKDKNLNFKKNLHLQHSYEYRVFHLPFLEGVTKFHENYKNHQANLQPK